MFSNLISKRLCCQWLLIGMVAVTCASAGEEQMAEPLSKEEVLTLLPQGLDMDDEADAGRYSALVEKGEIAYPALIAVIRESNDPIILSRALAVLRESSGNKSEVARQLKQIIGERVGRGGKDADRMLMATVEALADIGSEADMKALFPLLEHSSERVRIIAIRSIARRGGADAKKVLQTAKSKISADRERQEINDALLTIEERQNETTRSPVPPTR